MTKKSTAHEKVASTQEVLKVPATNPKTTGGVCDMLDPTGHGARTRSFTGWNDGPKDPTTTVGDGAISDDLGDGAISSGGLAAAHRQA